MAGEIQVNSVTALTESGSNIVLNNVDTATNRTNLGLGSMATQNANSVALTGGSITGTTIVPTSPFSFRNRIINGNLSNPINQRGAASITASTGYTYDRWYYDGTSLYQGIEDKNVNDGTYVISWQGSGFNAYWKLSTDTTANNGPDSTGGFSSALSSGDTFTVSGSGTGNHLWIKFSLDTAVDFSTLDKVMVEEGTVATPFEHRPYGTELALCQRHYATSIPQGYTILNFPTGADGAHMIAVGTNDLFGYIPFPVEMRARPTTYIYSSLNRTAGSIRRVTDGSDIAVSSYQPGTSNNKSLVYFNGVSGVSANQQFTFHYVAISEL
jgi:hypothetical protein